MIDQVVHLLGRHVPQVRAIHELVSHDSNSSRSAPPMSRAPAISALNPPAKRTVTMSGRPVLVRPQTFSIGRPYGLRTGIGLRRAPLSTCMTSYGSMPRNTSTAKAVDNH